MDAPYTRDDRRAPANSGTMTSGTGDRDAGLRGCAHEPRWCVVAAGRPSRALRLLALWPDAGHVGAGLDGELGTMAADPLPNFMLEPF
jgi:hypothetical protein